MVKKLIMEHSGGWCNHTKVSRMDNFKKKTKCDICNSRFTVTKKCNMIKEYIFIYITGKTSIQRRLFFPKQYMTDILQMAIRHSSVCPNCGNKKELYCIPVGGKIEGEKKEVYYD